ncbi:MAG: proprotein convertase P-domain-containing protein, partial [bacterium]
GSAPGCSPLLWTLTTLSGAVGAACAASGLHFETLQPLAQTVGEVCPGGGVLRISAGSQHTRVLYRAGGGVGLDSNDDGAAEQELGTCQEAPLLCAAPADTPTVAPTRTATAPASATRTSTASPSPIASATRTATGAASSTASPTAATATPTRSRTPTPSATSAVAALRICDTLPAPAAIPDSNATGIDNLIVVPPGAPLIADLNVELRVSHTWIGDLRATLTHVSSGRAVTLLDQPGQPATTNGCGLDNVDATFDDAPLRAAEDRCADGPPFAAIDGSVRPAAPLATFNGDSLAGTWRLNVSDRATQDTGALLGWCLVANSPAPVVTDFTCDNDDGACVVVVDSPFSLAFRYSDADGDAATWHMRARRDDGFEFEAGSGSLANGAGGSISLDFDPFTCPTADCPDTAFDYLVTVTDQQGHESPPQRLRLLVTLFGA